MSLKNPLLLTCAVIAVTAGVRSQATSAPVGAAPATPFDVARPAAPKAPQVPVVKGPPAASPSPFALNAPKPAPERAGGDGPPPADVIDLDALRYFAAQNDLGRVAAEIRLLRAKHPDWEPPQDLFSQVGSGVDERPLWDLLSSHDIAGVHAKMDAVRRDKPDWQPTADFADKLARAEGHDALVKASDAHSWDGVIAAAAATPSLLTCGDVDAMWRTAEALVRTGDEARAVAAYRYVLTNCTPADLRLATVQKASLLLTGPGALDGLIAMGHRTADGRGEFDQIRLDLARRRIGDATGNAAAPQPTPEEIAAVTGSAETPAGQADAQLLGWYARSRKDFAGAERWFRAALAAGPNAKAAEGLALALRDAGQTAEARKLVFRYAGLDPANRKLMVEFAAAVLSNPKAVPLDHDEVTAAMEGIDALRSAEGAQALGWHLYRQGDLAGAEGWFRKSADWGANASAARGLVVVARRLHHGRDHAARVAESRAAFPRIAERVTPMRSRPVPPRPEKVVAQAHRATSSSVKLARAGHPTRVASGDGWDKSADDIIKTYNAGQYDAAVAMLEQRHQAHAEPRGLSVIRGWALYHKGDWDGAKQVFSNLDHGNFSLERQEGLRVIQEAYTPLRMR